MSATSILKVEEPFKIFVGNPNAPKVIHAGNIDKGKTSIKSGESIMELEFIGGDESFPNYWEGWGRRVINGQAPATGKPPIEANDPSYKGEIEFLDPTDKNGTIIYCRYVKGQSTLDYQYQISRLNIIPKERDEENLMIVLPRGEHEIDPNKDRSYALALKIHPMNADSKNRMGRYGSTMYKEVKLMDTQKREVKYLQVDFEAKKIVNESSTSFSKLKVLHEVLSSGKEIKYNTSDENDLYETLMMFAHESPEEVIRLTQKYKENVSAVIEQAKSHNAFDTSTNGVLKVGGIKKEVLLDGIEAKGEEMIQYLFDSCLDPKSSEAIKRLNELSHTQFK